MHDVAVDRGAQSLIGHHLRLIEVRVIDISVVGLYQQIPAF